MVNFLVVLLCVLALFLACSVITVAWYSLVDHFEDKKWFQPIRFGFWPLVFFTSLAALISQKVTLYG